MTLALIPVRRHPCDTVSRRERLVVLVLGDWGVRALGIGPNCLVCFGLGRLLVTPPLPIDLLNCQGTVGAPHKFIPNGGGS